MRIKGIAGCGFVRALALGFALMLLLALPAGVQSQKAAQVFTWAAPTGASVQFYDLSRQSGYPFSKHTIQIDVSGAPSGCTVKLEGSHLGAETNGGAGPADGQYFSLSGDLSCTANTMLHVVNKHVRMVRMNRTAWSGGTNPSLSVYYVPAQ